VINAFKSVFPVLDDFFFCVVVCVVVDTGGGILVSRCVKVLRV